jgi:beta-glucosidase
MLVAAVQSGELEEAVLDQAVQRILALIFKAEETLTEDFTYDRKVHHDLARHTAGEGAVLLKNENSLLPLKENTKIALIGQFSKLPRYQGAGSSLINPTQLDNLYDELTDLVGADNLVYAAGYDERGDQADEALIEEAIAAAQSAEVVVICAGLTDYYEVEGLDRQHMQLPPGHEALIQRLSKAHDKVIIVLSNGSPVEMPWVNDVSAILEGYLGGQAGACALADLLVGKVNPSGKLAETFPLKLEDNPSHHYFPMGPSTVEYRESIYVGYRYYDTVKQDVLFPFGHGLSYTTFEYRHLQLSHSKISEKDNLSIGLKVKNIGAVAGKEIVQVYVRAADSAVFRPEKELKGFTKVSLQPGEEREVSIDLTQRAFSYFNSQINDWQVDPGTFEILVGASSGDIRLRASLEVKSSQAPDPQVNREQLYAYYNFPKGLPISQDDFTVLLGKPIPENRGLEKGNYTINTPVGDMSESFIGRQLYSFMEGQIAKMIEGQEGTPTAYLMQAMVREMPLRSMLMMGEGPFNREMLNALLTMINGHFFKGLFSFIKAAIQK